MLLLARKRLSMCIPSPGFANNRRAVLLRHLCIWEFLLRVLKCLEGGEGNSESGSVGADADTINFALVVPPCVCFVACKLLGSSLRRIY
jgi:hypothetical protein